MRAGITATGYIELRNFLNREDIAQGQAAERSRTDMETVLKLGPLLTSDNRTEASMAIILLDALLVDKAVNDRIAKPVLLLVQNTVANGQGPNATPVEQGNANAILAYVDSARINAIRRPEAAGATAVTAAAAPTPLLKALDQTALPARVYLQIGQEDDRPVANAAQKAWREAGLTAPGIELVAQARAFTQRTAIPPRPGGRGHAGAGAQCRGPSHQA